MKYLLLESKVKNQMLVGIVKHKKISEIEILK